MVLNLQNISDEIKTKYSITNNTFVLTNNSESSDFLETEIGDIKQTDFYPQVKIKRWDNEVNFSVRLKDESGETPQVITDKEKIKYQKSNLEAHFYHKTPDENLKDGGYEFEVLLKEKPISNILEFTVQTKGLKFYYQPPLTEEIKVGDENGRIVKVTETGAYVKDEKTDELISVTHRPENIVGSYAVYHESKSGDYSKMAGKNYRAGKAFHIHRPKIIDNTDNWVWGKLNIDETKGVLTVEIPQDFLDSAVYPVIVDPTFGYETAGASDADIYDKIRGLIRAGASGTGDSITAYTQTYGGKYKYALYLASDSSLVTNGTTNEGSTTGTSWKTLTFSTSPTLSSTNYIICAWAEYYGGVGLYYDSDENETGGRNTGEVTYNGWPDPATFYTFETTKKYSIYTTYTASGGTNVTTTPSAQSLTVSQPAITVNTVRNITQTPAVQVLTILQASITIDTDTSSVQMPDTQTLTISQPAVTVAAVKNTTQNLTTQSLTISQLNANVNSGITIDSLMQGLTVVMPAISVVTVKNATQTLQEQVLTISIPALTIIATDPAVSFYNIFRKNVMAGEIDFENDTIKAMLVSSSYTFDVDNHQYKSDITAEITGTGYTAGGEELTGKTVTQDNTNDLSKFDADDLTWNSATFTCRGLILYKDTGTDSTSPLIFYVDFGGDKSPNNENFTVSWSSNGVFTLSNL